MTPRSIRFCARQDRLRSCTPPPSRCVRRCGRQGDALVSPAGMSPAHPLGGLLRHLPIVGLRRRCNCSSLRSTPSSSTPPSIACHHALRAAHELVHAPCAPLNSASMCASTAEVANARDLDVGSAWPAIAQATSRSNRGGGRPSTPADRSWRSKKSNARMFSQLSSKSQGGRRTSLGTNEAKAAGPR